MVDHPPKLDAGEQWKTVPGYEGRYMISSYGRLYSVPRWIRQKARWGGFYARWWKGGLCVLRPDSGGYPCAYFGRLPGPLPNGIQIHRVVALVFIGPNPNGLDVRHKDDDVKNNKADNLEYGTRTQNILDARRSGRPWQKLTIEQAREIRYLKTYGFTYSALAEAYGVSTTAISNVVCYLTLKELKDYA